MKDNERLERLKTEVQKFDSLKWNLENETNLDAGNDENWDKSEVIYQDVWLDVRFDIDQNYNELESFIISQR